MHPRSSTSALADGFGSALRAVTRLVAVSLVGALLAGGVGNQIEHRLETARAEVAAEQAYRAALADHVEASHRRRVDQAQSARLTGAALQHAAVRRTEALAAARAAVEAARTVVVSRAAIPDVPIETLTPLGDAATRLVALIEATPTVPTPPARVSGVAPGATGDAATAAPPVPAATAHPVAHHVPTASGTAVASTVGSAPDAGSAAEPGPVDPSSPTGGFAPDVAATAPATTPTTAATPAPGALSLRSLDLQASAEMVAAARWVTDLSVHAQAAADAAVAAAQAARVAEEKARAAEEKARAEAIAAVGALAERVAAAEAAPNGRIPLGLLCAPQTAPDHLLRCDAAVAFDRLADAYRVDTGQDLRIVSGYRTFERQVELRESHGALAAPPGRSNHGRAIAVDLAGLGGLGQFTAPAYLWMQEHAGEFGWHHPAAMKPGGSGPPEPWHWEFGTTG